MTESVFMRLLLSKGSRLVYVQMESETTQKRPYRKGFSTRFILLQPLGICCFLFGFVPWSVKDTGQSSWADMPNSIAGFQLNSTLLYTPIVNNLVWVVVDALGADFLERNKPAMMPYLQNLLEEGRACALPAQAHTPTVTLPRIKALTTGSVPGFGDIFLNLANGDNALQEDNLLQQSKAFYHNVTFFGDETWTKLFPSTFTRSEGVPSFFVQDYTEVDRKVTRQLNAELEKNDWSIMILHYLGLDHIGHLSGPMSSLVPPKLQEMDQVIEKLYERLIVKHEKRRSAIFVCGDHGMSHDGSHGGSSLPETTIPLIFLLPQRTQCFDSAAVLQIDAMSSLSFLLGLPLPRHSLGIPLQPVLKMKSSSERLYGLYYLCTHLNGVYERQIGQLHPGKKDDDFDKAVNLYVQILESGSFSNEELVHQAEQLFLSWARDLQSDLTSQSTEKNVRLLFLGLGLVWMAFALTFFGTKMRLTKLEWLVVAGPFWQGLTLSSSSFVEEEHQAWYWIQATLAGIALIISLRNYCKLRNGAFIIHCIAALVLQRVLRSWVRTGDKWVQEPDIEDLLRENKPLLSLASIAGLSLAYFRIRERGNRTQRFLLIVGLFGCYLYRGAIAATCLPWFYPSSTGFWEAQITYASIFVLNLMRSTKISSTWLLLVLLLLKPHLHLPVALLDVYIENYSQVLQLLTENYMVRGIGYWSLAKASYFYLGYSNSLTRLDVSAGYVGLTNYYPVVVAPLLAVATFAGPGLSLLSGLIESVCPERRNEYLKGIALACSWPATLYPAFLWFLRDHLFIWTVFCPKLLFLLAESIVLLALIMSSTNIKL